MGWLGAAMAEVWPGGLDTLFVTLRREAMESEPSKQEILEDRGWHARILPRGALVAMRRRPDLGPGETRLELRIARKEAPSTGDGWQRWHDEIAVFLKRFEIEAVGGSKPCERAGRQWLVTSLAPNGHPNDEGKAAVRLVELREAEVRPGRALCIDCYTRDGRRREVEWGGFAPAGHRCGPHALEHGKAVLGHPPTRTDRRNR